MDKRGLGATKVFPAQRRKWLCFTLILGENMHKKCGLALAEHETRTKTHICLIVLVYLEKKSLVFLCDKIIEE